MVVIIVYLANLYSSWKKNRFKYVFHLFILWAIFVKSTRNTVCWWKIFILFCTKFHISFNRGSHLPLKCNGYISYSVDLQFARQYSVNIYERTRFYPLLTHHGGEIWYDTTICLLCCGIKRAKLSCGWPNHFTPFYLVHEMLKCGIENEFMMMWWLFQKRYKSIQIDAIRYMLQTRTYVYLDMAKITDITRLQLRLTTFFLDKLKKVWRKHTAIGHFAEYKTKHAPNWVYLVFDTCNFLTL